MESDCAAGQERRREPGVIYEESDLIIRTIRDIYNEDIDQILIDEKESFEKARDFLKMVMPRVVDRLETVRRSRTAVS